MRISEYVSVGHPDKVADYISEYILDRLLEQDSNTRYALEVQIKDNWVCLGGEITTNAKVIEWDNWVHDALARIGYTQEYCDKWGSENTINPDAVVVYAHISAQSPDIAQGVDNDGWGDQGIFWGMATRETRWALPLDYALAKTLCNDLYRAARDDGAPWGLDIKTQVVLDDGNSVQKVIVAAPCREENYKELRRFVELKAQEMPNASDTEPEIIVNGTGAYIKHASIGDCGTTGRKLVVDFYGGNCRIGGGCPWTKDPTKADLSLNVYARKLAIDYLDEHKEVDTVYVGIGCCIGKSDIDVTIYDKNNNVLESKTYIKKPKEVINELDLKEPMYAEMCMWGLWG